MKKIENSKQIQLFIQKQLGAIRRKQSMTQDQLASIIGVSPKTISDIENNRRGISVQMLIKICDILKIDLKKVFEIGK